MNIVEQRKSISSLYVLKAICAFLVVIIHFPMKYGYYFYPIVRIAVPCFFMISGYFLYSDNREKLISNLKRALRKTLQVTIWAYAFYLLVEALITLLVGNKISYGLGLDRIESCSWLTLIVAGPQIGVGHLWYLVAYVETLLFVMIFGRSKFNNVIYWLIPIGLLLNLLLGKYSFLLPLNDPVIFDTTKEMLSRNFITIGVPSFAIGMLIRKHQSRILHIIPLSKCFIICFISFIISTIEFAIITHYYGRDIAGDITIFTIPATISLMIICLRYADFGKSTYLSTIGKKYSSDIYIYHVFAGKFILISTEIVIYTLFGTYFKYMYAAPTVFVATLVFVIVWQRCVEWAKMKTSKIFAAIAR